MLNLNKLLMKSCPNRGHIKQYEKRHLATSKPQNFKVAVVGACGGIGQSLSLLLKLNTLVTELTLHDLQPQAMGVAEDLSHICVKGSVCAFVGDEGLGNCMCGADVICVSAGMPRKPGMTRDQLFKVNAGIAAQVACTASVCAPNAILAFITNPVNSVVPVAAEVLKSTCAFQPNRLFGVTTLDVVRAKAFIGNCLGVDPKAVSLPVIGGHAGTTILPLLSQCKPRFKGKEKELLQMMERIQEAGTVVVQKKDGKGSSTLAISFAAAHFVNALLRALNGEKNIVECAYVASDVTEVPYFSTPILLGCKGIERNLGLPNMSCLEKDALKCMIPELKKSIDNGINYVKQATCS